MTTNDNTLLQLNGKPKPWLNTGPKPWHKERDTTRDIEVDFEVLESKRPAPSPKKDKGEEEHVVLSCEGAEIVVPESIARISGLVTSILDSAGAFIEKQTRTIRFDHITPTVLEEVIRFCTRESQENPTFLQSLPQSPSAKSQSRVSTERKDASKVDSVLGVRTSFEFELKPDLVMELMAAAEYLQIPSLVSHIINMLAAYADDVPSFDGMSESLVEQVCNKCKPAALMKIEMDGKLDRFEKDFTTQIWKRFCGEYQDIVAATQRECRAKEATHFKYIQENQNANDNSAEPLSKNDVDWRRGYAELTMEKILSRIAPEAESELAAFTSVFGTSVLSLRLYHGRINPVLLSSSCPNIRFLEIVGHVGLDESQISTLVTLLPNLCYLRISNNGAFPRFWTDFLGAIEGSNIRELDLSSNDIGRPTATSVAGLLQKNNNIKILNIANNPIQLEGFMEIITAGANLQVLDASDCGITTGKQSEETLHRTPILLHNLKVLKLSGNNFVKLASSFWQYIFHGQSSLERLELARVMWVQKDKDVRVLIRHIAEFPNILYLDLSDNHLEELAMEAICFNLLLTPRSPLKTLVLTGNTVKDTLAAGLARALRYNNSLQTLILGGITEYGVLQLDTAISENESSAIQRIIAGIARPCTTLKKSHVFNLVSSSDPTYTYQMRWNPHPPN